MIKVLVLTFAIILCTQNVAQTLSGVEGIFLSPSAYTKPDGEIVVGVSTINKNSVNLYGNMSNLFSAFFSLTYLPGLELSLRLSKLTEYKGNTQTADRSINIKYNLLNESEFFPSLLLGIHNITRIVESGNHFNATYFVVGKRFLITEIINLEINLGYGLEIHKIGDYEFQGVFGSGSLSLKYRIGLFAEYLNEYPNYGIKANLLGPLSFSIGFVKSKYFSAMLSLSHNLN